MNTRIISWKKVGPGLFATTVPLQYEPAYAPGSMRHTCVMLRIDGRERIGGGDFRLDKLDVAIWEAIDGGEGFKTKEEAGLFAERWLQACIEQGTTFPNPASIKRE